MTMQRAQIAIQRLDSLYTLISSYLSRHQSRVDWCGPAKFEEWFLDIAYPNQSDGEDCITISWDKWVGCSCHGSSTRHTKTILFSELVKEV